MKKSKHTLEREVKSKIFNSIGGSIKDAQLTKKETELLSVEKLLRKIKQKKDRGENLTFTEKEFVKSKGSKPSNKNPVFDSIRDSLIKQAEKKIDRLGIKAFKK